MTKQRFSTLWKRKELGQAFGATVKVLPGRWAFHTEMHEFESVLHLQFWFLLMCTLGDQGDYSSSWSLLPMGETWSSLWLQPGPAQAVEGIWVGSYPASGWYVYVCVWECERECVCVCVCSSLSVTWTLKKKFAIIKNKTKTKCKNHVVIHC